MRQGMAVILRETVHCGMMAQVLTERQKYLQCNAFAFFHHGKQRQRLVLLTIHNTPCRRRQDDRQG
jgi:hypothetical protein